ncbi:right-handed parallel beta-helix repeat-containing protein [Coraliomargarita algicola]|uniref:Right-handed parallel beta-helix repeat-containing protein n=1 Tax=Coraliomargarita algicola TaxID=3092156 RepID=A0ABZ0RPH9_9BACT|nr:right-handed parallel beta-helix repeat-containing protein [Coraliomargarita sp. J2-16]WPJ97026.1 right-handed parallel beta-helix repeat-containing protein [Coraliomargarita sp. J2-16]
MKRLYSVCSIGLWLSLSATAQVYVSDSAGDDTSGSGAIDQPFKTIAKAMEHCAPGETVYIREGVYREVIVPLVDHLTIQAYAGEEVVISGCDVLQGAWSDAVHDANIKTTTTSGRVLQVFIGEDRMHLARFPNEDGNMLNKGDMAGTFTLGGVDEGTGIAQVRFDTSANLPDDGADTWVGGYYTGLNGTNVFTAAVGKITASSGRTLTCNDLSYYWRYNPEAVTQVGDGKGYIINHLRALDVPSEWYSADDGTFYLYPPAGVDLASTAVDVRTRIWGADLSQRSGITLEGLHFFASSVIMDASQNCVLRECHVEYPAPWSDYYHKGIDDLYWGQDYGAKEDGSTGVYVSGSNNLVENCWIEKSWGSGIRLRGTDNTIQGSLVEDCDWMMRRQQPIQAFGTRAKVLHNTVRRCAQSGIDGGNRTLGGYISSQLTVRHNIIEKAALLLHDTGAFYVNHQGRSSNGTEFAYNVVKDNTTNMPYGFYGDNGTDDMFVHHNLMVVPDAWMGIRFNGSRNIVFNNTVLYPDNAIVHQRSGLEGQRVHNNLGNKKIINDGEFGVVSHNTTNVPNSQFMDQAKGDYRIKPSYTTAVDGGIELSPYTDGFAGTAPDRGCYESGQPIWNAGSWVNAEITAAVGELLSEKPTDPIEINAAAGEVFADFSVVGGGMGVIPVRLNRVPGDVSLAIYRYFQGEVTPLGGIEGSDMGAYDYAYTSTDNGDGTRDYLFEIQRSTTLLSDEWRIVIEYHVNDAPVLESSSLGELVAVEDHVFAGSV